MAHEMIHLKQGISKTETPNAVHNAEFWRIAKSVCKRFGWDEKTFV
jgi:predicted metal-dependent hydrolase